MLTSIVSLKVVQEIKDFAYGITRTCQKLSRKLEKISKRFYGTGNGDDIVWCYEMYFTLCDFFNMICIFLGSFLLKVSCASTKFKQNTCDKF